MSIILVVRVMRRTVRVHAVVAFLCIYHVLQLKMLECLRALCVLYMVAPKIGIYSFLRGGGSYSCELNCVFVYHVRRGVIRSLLAMQFVISPVRSRFWTSFGCDCVGDGGRTLS